MYFLISTVIIIRRAFSFTCCRRSYEQKAKERRAKREFNIIFNLAVIMGGFWIGEFISTAIGIEYGHNATCYAQLFLDIPNLLAGFLIFLVTVVKKSVYLALKKKANDLTSQMYRLSPFLSRGETQEMKTESHREITEKSPAVM